MPPQTTFRPHEHLRRPADFRRVYAARRSVSDDSLIVYAFPNGLSHNRVGFSVSRKVGGAVTRNRIRRLFREAYRQTKHQMPTGLDLVLIPRSSDEPKLAALMDNLPRMVEKLAQKAGRSPPGRG